MGVDWAPGLVGIKEIPALTFIEGQHSVFMNNHFIYGILADISINHVGDVYGWYLPMEMRTGHR